MTINTNINSSDSSNSNNNNNNKTSSQYKKSSAIKQKIFAPNIPTKPRISTIAKANNNNDLFSPERVLNPTKLDLESRQKQQTDSSTTSEERIKQIQIQTEQIQKLQQQQIQQLQTVNNPKTKSVILKIKRKIDDDALPSIVIERPRKKAFLDSFKDFGLNSNDYNANPEKSNNDKEIDNDKDDYKLPKDLQQIPTSPSSPQQPLISTDKDKKLFTLITTLDDPSKSSKFVSKFQQRIEEFNQKGIISSPKQLESKKERTIKNRKESRYKQINTNRNLFTKEEKELFQDHEVIELERTILDPNNLKSSTLSKEEEELISNYKSLLDQHLDGENSSSVPMETKYVYDYYYFNPLIDQSSQLLRLHQENPDSIETVQLPPEDDFYDILDGGNSDDSSVDSENWYREYPSSEDDDDGFDDFDNYHGFGRRQQDSDDDYEHDEYEIDGDYYNEDDYDDYI